MNVTLYLIAGGLIGLLITVLIHRRGALNYLFNITLGVVGAFLAGWIFTPLYGISTLEPIYFNVPALGVGVAGAITLLAIGNFLRWGTKQTMPWRD